VKGIDIHRLDIAWPTNLPDDVLKTLKEFEAAAGIWLVTPTDVAVKLARRVVLIESQFKTLSRQYSELRDRVVPNGGDGDEKRVY